MTNVPEHTRLVLLREGAKLIVGLTGLLAGLVLVVAWGESGRSVSFLIPLPVMLAFLARMLVARRWPLPDELFIGRGTQITAYVFQAVMVLGYILSVLVVGWCGLLDVSWCV
jgi:hypothetical protein